MKRLIERFVQWALGHLDRAIDWLDDRSEV